MIIIITKIMLASITTFRNDNEHEEKRKSSSSSRGDCKPGPRCARSADQESGAEVPESLLVKGFEDALARAWPDGQSQRRAQCQGDGTQKRSPSETSSRCFVLPAAI